MKNGVWAAICANITARSPIPARATWSRRSKTSAVIDENKCVGCFTCILSCPYGAIEPDETGHVMQKCELCTKNGAGEPLCVKNCPNQAIVYEER